MNGRTGPVAVAGIEKMLHKVRWALGEVSLYQTDLDPRICDFRLLGPISASKWHPEADFDVAHREAPNATSRAPGDVSYG